MNAVDDWYGNSGMPLVGTTSLLRRKQWAQYGRDEIGGNREVLSGNKQKTNRTYTFFRRPGSSIKLLSINKNKIEPGYSSK
jgi:hypothetical protein